MENFLHNFTFQIIQVAHFYNTIDSEMIQSQQPMMIDLAKGFERVVKDPKVSRKELNILKNIF